MTENRTVAVCDILGFRSLVLTRPLQELLHGELALFRKLVSFSVKHGDMPPLPPELHDMRSQNRVGFAWFSDTVLIYSRDDTDISCRNVIETVAWLLFSTMFTLTKVRAGIAYGEFTADSVNEAYFGRAIIEAYELEQAQEWAGAALTQAASDRLPRRDTTGARLQWHVCEYPVPLKPKHPCSNCSGLAVDWTQGIHTSFALQWSRQRKNPSDEERQNQPSICAKWDNTKRFHDTVCIQCHPHNRVRDPLKVF